jgi:hypothetical protein
MPKAQLKARPAAVSGNAAVLDIRRERGEWVVEFMSEPRNGTERLWFNLECTGAGGRRVRFAWMNAHLCLGTGSAEAMANARPVVRLDAGDWRRVKKVQVHERPLGGHFLTFTTPAPCRRVQAAFCYPYGPDDLKATLKKTRGIWDVEAIGLTGKGRELLRVHAAADKKRPGRPGVYIVARQHSGEVPGTWVLDGILRAVAAEEPARRLRRIEWWAVPFVDLDGAVEGNYGKDCFPIDFNRAWADMPMRPEVGAIQEDLRYFAEGRRRRLVLDLHGPGGGETRVYMMHPRKNAPKAQREAAKSLQECICAQIPEQPPERLGVVPEYGIRWNWRHNLSSWAWDGLNKTLGVTIETAYQPIGDGLWSDRDDYREIGRRLANAAAVWLTRRRKPKARP